MARRSNRVPEKKRQIVAIGGASFRAEPENLAADRYILDLTRKKRPSICFVPTASAEPADSIATFYDAYTRLGAKPSVLRLFRRTPDLRTTLLSQDAIYVGGGNTKSMLAVWREWGLDAVLREAWRKGIVLAGVSAGAICWFTSGTTDSFGADLRPFTGGLGLLEASYCPHYDSEPRRRPLYQSLIADRSLPPGIACDDGAAAHFVDDTLAGIVADASGPRGYSVSRSANGGAAEIELDTKVLIGRLPSSHVRSRLLSRPRFGVTSVDMPNMPNSRRFT